MCSEDFKEDAIWLNKKQEKIDGRLEHVISQVQSRATRHQGMKVHIVSENNFPTAAGLASSASGFCCLAYALGQLYGVEGDLSGLARIGSGSACRSMYGGYVKWEMGSSASGEDSIAVQVAPETHWPEIEVLICVVNDARKETSSTAGMQQSALTSPKMKERTEAIVPRRMAEIEKAILAKDYETFGRITMDDSDDFHQICAETTPAIHYLNDTSREVIRLIRSLNEKAGEVRAAYTFDAGPNAVIYLPRKNIPEVLSLLLAHFPAPEGMSASSSSVTSSEGYVRGGSKDLVDQAQSFKSSSDATRSLWESPRGVGALKYILHTTIGPGPQVLHDQADCLIDASTGLPKSR
eukprot:TRINITY_DN2024_c0_g1_i1.p1 TRINITY_DN2024_c0_g1~~TRINITY_DN2024_c0_g1_i1.p1  ORF type:complete len:411 (+),score=115.36 TRINITY_DN2024_c0_g1_i1:182-1234(+)